MASISLDQVRINTKSLIRRLMPLFLRKALCIWVNHQQWLSADSQYWWTKEMLRDFEEKDRDGYHRYLWSHHLAYAHTYEVEKRFGEENIVGSRKLFFNDLEKHLMHSGIHPQKEIRSVFEVGCSLGYQLRYMETAVFPSATVLEGNDIDSYAITNGTEYLLKKGSKIKMINGDMGNLGALMKGKSYDILIGTGVLMYLQEKEAARVVETMIGHSRIMVALSGLAHPEKDNALLEHSAIREMDGSFIHNIDVMVEKAGGHVVSRRWEGDRKVDGQSIYFIFAHKD